MKYFLHKNDLPESVEIGESVAIDTETTGLDYKTGDRIIEVGCVELKNYVPTGKTLQFYCKPDRSISEGAKNIVGLSDDFLISINSNMFSEIKLLISFLMKLIPLSWNHFNSSAFLKCITILLYNYLVI